MWEKQQVLALCCAIQVDKSQSKHVESISLMQCPIVGAPVMQGSVLPAI